MINKLLKKYDLMPIAMRAAIWYFICSFLQKSISVLTTPVFTRLMSTDEFGKYGVFTSWQGLLAIFITLSISSGVYGQGLVKFESEKNILSSSLQGLVLTMIIFWTAIYFAFRQFFNSLFSLTTLQTVSLLVITWAETAYSFWAAEQRVELSYKRLVILTIAVSFLKPAVGIMLVSAANDKVTARVVGIAAVEIVAYSGLFISQMKRGKVFFSKKYWKYALAFNIPLIPHYLSQTVLNSSDRIMISRMVDESSAGIYSLAYSVSMVMMMFNLAISQTINPWILKKIKLGRIKETENIAYFSFTVVAAANLLLIAFAPEAVSIFAPASYREAVYVIPPIAMSVYFIFAYDFSANVEFYYEKNYLIMIASLMAAIANVILNYIFIGIFGYIAAGYTTLICYIAYAVLHFIFMRRICITNMNGLRVYEVRKLVHITLSFLAVGFCYQLTYRNIVLRYGMTLIILIVVFINRKKLIDKVSAALKSMADITYNESNIGQKKFDEEKGT